MSIDATREREDIVRYLRIRSNEFSWAVRIIVRLLANEIEELDHYDYGV